MQGPITLVSAALQQPQFVSNANQDATVQFFFGMQFTKIGLLTPEHEGITFLRNVGNYFPQTAFCNTPEDLNIQQYSCETGNMEEELETKLYVDCCSAKEWNGTAWFGLEVWKLRVIMRSAVKGGCPLHKEEEWGTYGTLLKCPGARRGATNFFFFENEWLQKCQELSTQRSSYFSSIGF